MRSALDFLASTTAEERNEAYGHAAWALALVAAFVVLFAAVTPDRANGAERATGLSPTVKPASGLDGFATSIPFAGDE